MKEKKYCRKSSHDVGLETDWEKTGFLIIAPTVDLSKLHAYCRLGHPSVILVYSRVPGFLRQLFGLGIIKEIAVWLFKDVDKCLLDR